MYVIIALMLVLLGYNAFGVPELYIDEFTIRGFMAMMSIFISVIGILGTIIMSVNDF